MRALRATIAFAAAAALLGALGGAVTGQDEGDANLETVDLTAVADFDAHLDPGTLEFGDVVQLFGVVEVGNIREPSDPRFAGTWTWTGNQYQYPGFKVWNGGYRIENDDGAWQQVPTVWLTGRGSRDPHTVTSVFIGEGAYAGWTVIAETAHSPTYVGFAFDGVMFEGQIPPPPAE